MPGSPDRIPPFVKAAPLSSARARSHDGFLRSAGIVSAATAVSRITGLIRESVLGWLFGAGATFDAYAIGYRVANFARDLFAEGALASAFVPTFTRYLTTRTREQARELSNITATLLIVIAGALCALGMLFSSEFVELFAPGFHAVPGKFELATRMVRTMFPFLLLVAMAAQAQGILFACGQFGVPSFSSSLFNAGSVIFGLTLGYWLGPRLGISPVQGMAYGILFGGAAQLAFQLPAVWRAGFAWKPQWNLHHEGVSHILRLMGPAILGGAALQINLLVNTNIAAGLRDSAGHVMNGPVSWLSYAYRFMQLPMGLFAVSVASATLPRISKSAAENDFAAFRDTLSRSLVTILVLTIPSSVGLLLLGDSMIGIVYQHGRFLAFDTRQTGIALSFYALGLAGYSSVKLLAPAFYALGDARTPMLISLASVAVNAFSAVVLVHGAGNGALRYGGLGYAGLALSVSLVATVNAVLLAAFIRPRIGGLNGRVIAVSLIKILSAAAVMGAVVYGLTALSHASLTSVPSARIADVVLGVPAGAIVFYATASALGIDEIAEARDAVLRKLRKIRDSA
jgi:putative peptidoglycan lipid II flippase